MTRLGSTRFSLTHSTPFTLTHSTRFSLTHSTPFTGGVTATENDIFRTKLYPIIEHTHFSNTHWCYQKILEYDIPLQLRNFQKLPLTSIILILKKQQSVKISFLIVHNPMTYWSQSYCHFKFEITLSRPQNAKSDFQCAVQHIYMIFKVFYRNGH